MAVVLNPFYSSKARGSVGGMTATRSGVGAVMKHKARPPHRARPVQPRSRSILGWVARQYGSLTAAQRDEWEAYAQNHPQPDGFGGTFILTPEQAYIMLNVPSVHFQAAAGLHSSPPVDPPPASVTQIALTDGISSGEVVITVTLYGTGSANDNIQYMRAGPFQSPGRVEVHNRYRDRKATTGVVLTYTYEGLVPEMYYWFKARYIDQYGQVTNWIVGQHKAPTV